MGTLICSTLPGAATLNDAEHSPRSGNQEPNIEKPEQRGDQESFAQLYHQLRKLAIRLMRGERSDHTLQPTALVHEAFLSLTNGQAGEWRDRVHFLAAASRAMRHVLVDYARAKSANRRGGNAQKVTLEGLSLARHAEGVDLLLIDEALTELQVLDERKARVIELRCFGGCSVDETAQALGVSKPTVILDTRMARAWLYDRIFGGTP